jgi:hypothetical protein
VTLDERTYDRQLILTLDRPTMWAKQPGDLVAYVEEQIRPWWHVWLKSRYPYFPWYSRFMAPRVCPVMRYGIVQHIGETGVSIAPID